MGPVILEAEEAILPNPVSCMYQLSSHHWLHNVVELRADGMEVALTYRHGILMHH